MIVLNKDKGYKWGIKNNIYAKGYLFDENNNLFKDSELIAYFEGIKDRDHFVRKLKNANGLFSVIIKEGTTVFMAVDRSRSFPLFYTLKNKDLIISDSVEPLVEKLESRGLDDSASVVFLAAGYVTGNKTLINNIFQLQAGEYVYSNNGEIIQSFYHTFIPERITEQPADKLTSNFLMYIELISKRTAKILENKVAVVPLSGGYDSRLVACILKKTGINDVICFTYGRKNNYEIDISRKVAEKLGYKWLYIEYNNELIKDYLYDNLFMDYFRYSANYTSMFFMQEYFALKFLNENKLVPGNSVFIPGHSGDVLAGGHLWQDISEKTPLKHLAGLIYEKHYILNKPPNTFRKTLIEDIYKSLGSSRFPYAEFQNWELKERHAKFIVNSANIYNFFGYQHVMPLWDLDFLGFFTELPYRHRKFKNLYNHVLKEYIFQPFDLNFVSDRPPSKRFLRMQLYKNKLKQYIPEIIKKPFYHHPDRFRYKEITSYMINDLNKRNYKVNTRVQYGNAYIVQWYLNYVKENINKGSIS